VKRVIQTLAWIFLALDAAALVFFLTWRLTASSREGEDAYAMVFFLLMAAFVGGGGGALYWSARRGSALGVGCAAAVLGLPAVVALSIWISNLL
jgi:hypothetical protein